MNSEIKNGILWDNYRWLIGKEGAALLMEISKLPDDRLVRISRLRKCCSPERCEAAVELVELRKRAAVKFQNSASLLLTSEGLEQSTSAVVANYRASKMPLVTTLDACCGIGGDAIALANGRRVVAVDINPLHVFCTHVNTIHSPNPVLSMCADVAQLDLSRLRSNGIQAAFFDPSRRQTSRGSRIRIKDSESYHPALSWGKELAKSFLTVGIKASPAIDDGSLKILGGRTEFVSYRGSCREALIWLGDGGHHLPSAPHSSEDYHATVIHADGAAITLSPFECSIPDITDPQEWIYEPDPAVIRAHLLPQAASLIDGAQIDSNTAYLTAKNYVWTSFTTAYRLLDWLPYHPRQLQQRLKKMGKRVEAIKLRSVPLKPEELIKTFKGTGNSSDPAVILFLMRRGEKILTMICELPVTAAT